MILGEGRKREVDKFMATESERSKSVLRNPGISFSWGTRRCLRCVKENPNGEDGVGDGKSVVSGLSELDRGSWLRDRSEMERRGSSDRRESFKVPPMRSPAVAGCSGYKSNVDDEIEAVRTKLTFDLQTAANRLKDAIVWEGLEMEPHVSTPASVPVPVDTVQPDGKAEKPWNLRTRRSASKDCNGIRGGGEIGGNDGGGMSFKDDILKPKFPSLRSESVSTRLRGSLTGGGVALSGQKKERDQFSLSLSRKEIEEDFMAMTGQKLPRRPKKRAKNTQKELEKLFPGTWLREVNADMYIVYNAR